MTYTSVGALFHEGDVHHQRSLNHIGGIMHQRMRRSFATPTTLQFICCSSALLGSASG